MPEWRSLWFLWFTWTGITTVIAFFATLRERCVCLLHTFLHLAELCVPDGYILLGLTAFLLLLLVLNAFLLGLTAFLLVLLGLNVFLLLVLNAFLPLLGVIHYSLTFRICTGRCRIELRFSLLNCSVNGREWIFE
jgi:hypothetical protein